MIRGTEAFWWLVLLLSLTQREERPKSIQYIDRERVEGDFIIGKGRLNDGEGRGEGRVRQLEDLRDKREMYFVLYMFSGEI